MEAFRYYHPIEVRYGDLDPQGHVNNARYLTYLEQARVSFVTHLGLWDGRSYLDVGFILAEVKVTFQAPILLRQKVQVGVRTTRLGNKSLDMVYVIENQESKQIYATASTVLVAYDYHTHTTIPIPEHWRTVLSDFDSID